PSLTSSTLFPYTTLFRSLTSFPPCQSQGVARTSYERAEKAWPSQGLCANRLNSPPRNRTSIDRPVMSQKGQSTKSLRSSPLRGGDRKSTRLNSSHQIISY